MTYQVTLTPTAQTDLREIFRYIAFDLSSLQNASRQLDRLEQAIASLNQMPERFPVYDRPKWRERNLRKMPVDNYLVFYIPDHNRSTVTVLRILYGGRNMEIQLNRTNS